VKFTEIVAMAAFLKPKHSSVDFGPTTCLDVKDSILNNYKKMSKNPMYLSEAVEEQCSTNGVRQAEYLDSSLTNTDVWEWKHNRNYRLAHYMIDKFKNSMGYSEQKFNGNTSDDEVSLAFPLVIIALCAMTFQASVKNGETNISFKFEKLTDYFDCFTSL